MPNTSPSLTDFYIYQFIYFTNLYWFYLLNIPHIYSLIYLPSKYPSYILTLSSLVHVVGSSPQNCYSHSIFSFKTITYLNWRLITLQFCDFFFYHISIWVGHRHMFPLHFEATPLSLPTLSHQVCHRALALGALWSHFWTFSFVTTLIFLQKNFYSATKGNFFYRKMRLCLSNLKCFHAFPTPFSISLVTQSRPTLCNPLDCSTPGLPVHHQLSEFTQTHVHWVSDAIQPSCPLSFPSPPTFNLSQHQDLFEWVSSSHQVAKVLEFQLQHKSFQWIFRTGFL